MIQASQGRDMRRKCLTWEEEWWPQWGSGSVEIGSVAWLLDLKVSELPEDLLKLVAVPVSQIFSSSGEGPKNIRFYVVG